MRIGGGSKAGRIGPDSHATTPQQVLSWRCARAGSDGCVIPWSRMQSSGVENDGVVVHVHALESHAVEYHGGGVPGRDVRFLSKTRRLADAKSSTAGYRLYEGGPLVKPCCQLADAVTVLCRVSAVMSSA
jgi:hypothetical protein